MNLTPKQRDFLERVRDGRPLKLASRFEDRVRQSMRKAGYVAYVGKPRRWQISQAGIAALASGGKTDA